MLQRLLRYLDESGLPTRLVAWVLSRRLRSRLSRYLLRHNSATNAVTLSVASPTLSAQDLMENALPRGFGSWRDYRICATLVDRALAVAVLEEPRSRQHFSLVLPVHEDFNRRRFRRLQRVRITCEAERSGLLTLRHRSGELIAAGTLELVPRAAFSKEVLE
jgi:hypothetical protein